MSALRSTYVLRIESAILRIESARQAGVASGVASLFMLRGRERPAPPLVRRDVGSLREDGHAIKRDGERLFGVDAG